MKKKLMAGFLAAILAVGSANVLPASAEETNLPTVTDGMGLGDISQETDTSYLQDTVISPYFIKTSETASEYTKTPLDIPAGSEDVTLIYPVTVPEKGAVTLMASQNDTVAFSSLAMELYSDVACTEKYGNVYYYGDKEYELKQIFCPNAGTYYLKVVFDRKYNVTDAKSFTIGSYFISNADRKLAADTMAFTYSDYENKDVMYEVRADKAGVIAFTVLPTDYTSLLTGNVTLYNAKKEAVSTEEYISNSGETSSDIKYAKAYYTVKEGTYYIKFSSYSSTGFYLVGYSLVGAEDTSGSSMKKATKLKIGAKEKQGMVLVTDSMKEADWYKLTLTKKMKFTIVVNAYVSGKVKMEVCDSKGRTVLFGTKNLTTGQYKLPTKGKWSKGTYYIKLTKYDKKSCGYYELKVKK